MPRGDRTGPLGVGPMTGRRAGYCSGFPTQGYANQGGCIGGFGSGYGNGRGYRRMLNTTGMPGWMFDHYAAYTGSNEVSFDEKSDLEHQVELLETQLQKITNRLNNLKE